MHSFARLALVLVALAACGDSDDDGPSTITLTTDLPSGEGSGDVIVTAHREGGPNGAISVSFETLAGTALADTDFVAASGSVEWADNDTADKTFTISLVDDVTVESAEAFAIELAASDDATLASTTIDVPITDDDGPGDKYGVTSAGRLVHFATNEFGRLSYAYDLSGLGSEKLVGIDYRPSDGLLYGLSDGAKLYTIDPNTGTATLKSSLAADPADTASPFATLPATLGLDFDPVADRLRIVGQAGENLHVDVDTGLVTTDAAINGNTTGYVALAHNHNIKPACRTTLYAIDIATNRFVIQDPITGVTQGVGGLGFQATAINGFDIVTDLESKHVGEAILTRDGVSGSYAIDLGSGRGTLHRAVGPLMPGETIVSFAMPPLPPDTNFAQREGEYFGVTATDVVSFTPAHPERLCIAKPLTGLAAGEVVLSADMRPSTGVLYVLTKVGTAGKLHRIDPATGNLSPEIPITVPLQGTTFGMDFNPTGPVALRIISDTGQNIRVTDVDTGEATADTNLSGTATDVAYTDALQGAGTTTLYSIDTTTDRLLLQNPPNSGTLVAVGPLGADVSGAFSFDIDGRNNVGTVVTTDGTSSQIRTVNLATGALSASLGTIAGPPLLGVTRATPTTTLYGLTAENRLVSINLNDPSMVTINQDPMAEPPTDTISGLGTNERLVGIDTRPSNGVIYSVSNLGRLYTVNSFSAEANDLGLLRADPADTTNPFTALAGTTFAIEFDPMTTGMRIVSDIEQSLSIADPANPMVVTDAPLMSSAGPVDIVATAYTNSIQSATAMPTTTTLYAIDGASNRLMRVAPTGALTVVGPLGAQALYAPNTHPGFDIAGGNNGVVLAAFQRAGESFSRLYRIDLATGAATEIGNGIGGAALHGLTINVR
jgi:hypothetical protein